MIKSRVTLADLKVSDVARRALLAITGNGYYFENSRDRPNKRFQVESFKCDHPKTVISKYFLRNKAQCLRDGCVESDWTRPACERLCRYSIDILQGVHEADFLALWGVGKKSVAEIEKALFEYGIEMGRTPPKPKRVTPHCTSCTCFLELENESV